MKYLVIILIGLLSVSCMTTKRIEKHCDDFAKVCITDVKTEVQIIRDVQTEVIYRDTTIYIKVPGKEVIKEVPVYIEKGIVDSELSILKVPYAISYSQVISSTLRHELVQTDTILRVKLEDALKYSKTLEKQNKILKEKYVVTVTENSNFAKVTIKVFWGLVVIVILGIGYLVLKNKAKLLGLLKKFS